MKNLPNISEAEWRVMRVLWGEAPRTANDVVEALRPHSTWNPRTVKTLINRLVKKEALGFRQDGRVYHYYPLVDEAACVKAESRSFLQRVYGGAFKPMLVSFLEDADLSDEDLAELKRILDKGRA